MTIYFDVFGPLMKNWITSNLNSTWISEWRWVGWDRGNPISASNPWIHIALEKTIDMEWYSASVDYFDIQSFFLHFHDINDSPKNMHQPVTERKVSGHPAQSESLNASRRIGEPLGKNNPRVEVPRRYWMMRRTTNKWRWGGACINRLTCCTTREISGRETVR